MIGLGILVIVLSIIGHYSGKGTTGTPFMKHPSTRVSADESRNAASVFVRTQTLNAIDGQRLGAGLNKSAPRYVENADVMYRKGRITATSLTHNAWYIGTKSGRVAISLNHKTWRDVSQTLPHRAVTSIAQSKTNFGMDVAAVGLGAGPNKAKTGRVFLTLNHGKNWIDITGDLPNETVTKIQFQAIGENRELVVEMNHHWYGLSDVEGKWRLLP